MLKKMRGFIAIIVVVLSVMGWYEGVEYINNKTAKMAIETAKSLGLDHYGIDGTIAWSTHGELITWRIHVPKDEFGPETLDVINWMDLFR